MSASNVTEMCRGTGISTENPRTPLSIQALQRHDGDRDAALTFLLTSQLPGATNDPSPLSPHRFGIHSAPPPPPRPPPPPAPGVSHPLQSALSGESRCVDEQTSNLGKPWDLWNPLIRLNRDGYGRIRSQTIGWNCPSCTFANVATAERCGC